MSKLIAIVLTFLTAAYLVAGMLFGHVAHASPRVAGKVTYDESGTKSVFKVNGKISDMREVSKAADVETNVIEKCIPVKDAMDLDGKPIGAVKCNQVHKNINPKTGNTTWKRN